jgi:hypothetical protein
MKDGATLRATAVAESGCHAAGLTIINIPVIPVEDIRISLEAKSFLSQETSNRLTKAPKMDTLVLPATTSVR